jgi:hypothetical protein
MKTILALTIAGAAFAAAASVASAQEDCAGGYRMIKDQVPITCGGGPTMFQHSAIVPAQEEPLTTGSIRTSDAADTGGGNSDQIPTGGNAMVFADSRDSCKAGEYYMQDMQSMNFPVRCP